MNPITSPENPKGSPKPTAATMTTGRLEAFSDGAFAIAITLLVLGIAVPSPARRSGLSSSGSGHPRLRGELPADRRDLDQPPRHLPAHRPRRRHAAGAQHPAALVFAFLPFPTAVLAEAFLRGTDEGIAVTLYGGTLVVDSLFANAVWQYAARGHLLGAHLTAGEARQIGRRYLVGLLLYAVSIVVGLVPAWLALYACLAAFYLWPGGIDEVTLAGTADLGVSTGRREGDS